TNPAVSRRRLEIARGRLGASARTAGEAMTVLMRRSAYSLAAGRRARGAIRLMLYCNRLARRYIPGRMNRNRTSAGRLDQIAMGLSGLCLVHCIATAILLGLLATAGGILGSPIIHEVGLTLAMIIGTIALVRGVREHGFVLPAIVGALGL